MRICWCERRGSFELELAAKLGMKFFGRSDEMIDKATKSDCKDIAKLAILMWENHTLEELIEEFETVIQDKECAIFIVSVDDKKIGFAQCQLRHDYVEGTKISPVGYLEGIFVKEEYRKQGYAKKLLSKCEEWAKEQGCAEFASDCELDNVSSLEFHMKMGFEEANRIICFAKEI